MKKALIALIILASITLNVTAAIGDWKIYMSYSEPQQIQETGNYLFIQASNSLYLYNKNDQSIQTFDKTTGMSDVVVTNISWNQKAKRLVVVYDNSNIDLIDLQGNVTNVPDLYNKSMTEDKTVNSIVNNDKYAYIATNFGGIKLNVSAAEISESYLLGQSIKRFAVSGSIIYALNTQSKAISATLDANLQDKANWTSVTTYPAGIFDVDNSAYTNNIELVKTLNPGGPKTNQFGFMKFKNGALYTCTGTDWNFSQPAAIQVLKNDEWDIYKDDYIPEMTGQKYWDMMCLDVYGNKLAAGTRNGVYIFENGTLKEFYNHENSILETFSNSGNPNYVLITGLNYDNNGNLWIFNSAAPSQSILELKSNGTFVSHKQSGLMVLEDRGAMKSARKMTSSFIDSNNNLWFVNHDWVHSSAFRYDINNDMLYDFFTYKNQDGAEISNLHYFKSIVEDKQNNEFLIGTDVGLLILPKDYINDPSKGFVQFKVPRNDGTNLADYLMSGIDITCIAIDGGGRKWIGTNGAGVFVISQDKLTQTLHLESKTSKLISDIILSIAIDNDNGEVFIGTEKGLCSYTSDATTPNDDLSSDNVYAYPNPVEPDYTGMIMVRGLPNNSDIKILSSNGAIVAEGRSNGGSFMWDGCNRKGERVASGVYMVAIAGSEGEKGTVCKIAVIR